MAGVGRGGEAEVAEAEVAEAGGRAGAWPGLSPPPLPGAVGTAPSPRALGFVGRGCAPKSG